MAMTDEEKRAMRRMEKAKDFLKRYMQDDATLNRLIRKEECTPEDRELAIILSMDLFNSLAPITTYSLNDFPNLLFLLKGDTIEMLTMKGILHSRNELSYSSGGLSIKVHEKARDYPNPRIWFHLYFLLL